MFYYQMLLFWGEIDEVYCFLALMVRATQILGGVHYLKFSGMAIASIKAGRQIIDTHMQIVMILVWVPNSFEGYTFQIEIWIIQLSS